MNQETQNSMSWVSETSILFMWLRIEEIKLIIVLHLRSHLDGIIKSQLFKISKSTYFLSETSKNKTVCTFSVQQSL